MAIRRLLVVLSVCVALVAGAVSTGAARRSQAAAATRPLRVLVTNDDGVSAPGIDAVVERLRRVPGIVVTVVAPATNQSGTGDRFSTTPITAADATTAHGYHAIAVQGFPADSVLLAVRSLLKDPPDLVVSGINQGQNIGELTNVSGTVGAARTAARLGIPAIAVSQGLPADDYSFAASLTSFFVQGWRTDLIARPNAAPKVFNVNVPSCGTTRGVKFVPVGRSSTVASYTETSTGTFRPNVESRNLFSVDCASTQRRAVDDIDAFVHGFTAVSRIAVN